MGLRRGHEVLNILTRLPAAHPLRQYFSILYECIKLLSRIPPNDFFRKRGFEEEIVADMEMFVDSKSERWQESEQGQALSEWKTAWETLMMDEISIDMPEELEVPETSHADDLADAPDDVDSL